MTANEFLAIFPAVKRGCHTGGGCTAWEMPLTPRVFIMITESGGDPCQPKLSDKKAAFGVVSYDADQEPPHVFTWAEARVWLSGVTEAARTVSESAEAVAREADPVDCPNPAIPASTIAEALMLVKGITPTPAHEIARRDCIIALAYALARQAPKEFDRERFMVAAGLSQ